MLHHRSTLGSKFALTNSEPTEPRGFSFLRHNSLTLTAVLVDAGFFLKRAARIYGAQAPDAAARQLHYAALDHLNDDDGHRVSRLYRILDFVWPRAAGPGRCEVPHCDWVYVGRGTRRVLTVWIPLMDVPMVRGPIMVLEGSHRDNELTRKYLNLDADKLGFFGGLRIKHGRFVHGGRYSRRPDKVQEEFGTRWLTEDFKMGDVLLFGPELLHATLDNHTDGFRLSIDTRFQPVSEPMDPRFVGVKPELHSKQDKSIIDYYTLAKRWVTGRDVARSPGGR